MEDIAAGEDVVVAVDRRQDQVALLAVLTPVVLDYRIADNASASVTIYFVVLSLCIAGALTLAIRHGLSKSVGLRILVAASVAFLIVSVSSGILSGDDPVGVARSASSVVIFAASTVAMSAISRSGRSVEDVWRTVATVALVGVAVQLALVLATTGIDLTRVRYEVLTGVAPYATALVVASIVYGGWRWWTVALAVAHTLLVALSVTRTQLFVASGVVGAAFLFAPIRFLSRRSLYRFIAIVPVLVVGLLVVDAMLPVSQLERWVFRLTAAQEAKGGIDVTEVTRVGEATYQIRRLSEAPEGLLFGFGPAAVTEFDDLSAQIVASAIGVSGGQWEGSGFGHNNYVGTLYVGGILFGGALIIVQLATAFAGVGVFRRSAGLPLSLDRTLLLAIPLGVVAYLLYGLLGGTMASRSASALFGIAMASVWWLADTGANSKFSDLRLSWPRRG